MSAGRLSLGTGTSREPGKARARLDAARRALAESDAATDAKSNYSRREPTALSIAVNSTISNALSALPPRVVALVDGETELSVHEELVWERVREFLEELSKIVAEVGAAVAEPGGAGTA